jgi:ProP effector
LKIGIRAEVEVAAAGAITPIEIEAAFDLYTRRPGYLRALKEGVVRVDLDGNPAGVVTAIEAAHARRHIERLEARASARTRARGLAIEEAARKARAEAEQERRATEEASSAAHWSPSASGVSLRASACSGWPRSPRQETSMPPKPKHPD